MPAETATINNLISDFETKPNLITALASLDLSNWVGELKVANATFNEKYIERTQEFAISNPENIKTKRVVATTAYYALREMLTSQAIVNKNIAPYPKAISEINTLIEQYNSILKLRTTKGGNEDGEEKPTR